MQNERKQVLQLLAEGKISADDAERLLDKLASTTGGADSPPVSRLSVDKGPKFMRVLVDSCEGDQVDIRLPIGLLRSGISLSAMMPREAAEAMKKNGVDFSQFNGLSGDEFMSALRSMTIDVCSHDGDQVKIYCE
jgi:hypothetical protein